MGGPMDGEFIFSGCICCASACDFKDILIGCKTTQECLCIVEKCCCAANEDKMPIGMAKESGDICRISLPCCQIGLKKPDVCVLGDGKCLCIRQAAAFPFKDPISGPVCAICAVRILPSPVGVFLPMKR
eukprot:GFYU01000212.1.p2 GENE.GFYU01000212.1~~GFYU01000212.1.p2  ORF type:complete len:151 (+),score=32.16 GFYU01000212.1:67-453(+)